MQQKRPQLWHEEDVLLREVQALDVAEERQCGGARRGDEWPAELAFRGEQDKPPGGPPNKSQRRFPTPSPASCRMRMGRISGRRTNVRC